MRSPESHILEGCKKYGDGYFRISTIQDEIVVVSDYDKINEYLRAPDNVLSFVDSSNDVSISLSVIFRL